MSASLVAAATAGIVLGVGATLVLSPSPRRAPPSSSSTLPPPPSPAFPPPRDGLPAKVVYGGLTASEVLGRSLQSGTIGPISDFIRRQAYTTAYDRRNRIPAWTAEHLTAASLKKPPAVEGGKAGGDRSGSTFKEDESIPSMFRAHLLDYFKSGYDRGHMVPAADAKMSQMAMDETFILTNIAPQVGDGFNRHYWAYLEQFCRTLTGSFEDVYVFTVPLFLPKQDPRDGKWRVSYEMIAPQNSPPTIAVPTHFAKVILSSRPPRASVGALVKGSGADKEWSVGAFVLPNAVIPDDAPLTSFVVPVEAVEMSAGLTLIPDQLKAIARPLCQTVECKVIARRFDDAQKKVGGGGKGGRGRSASV